MTENRLGAITIRGGFVGCRVLTVLVLACLLPVFAQDGEKATVSGEDPLGQPLNVDELATLKRALTVVHFDEYIANELATKYEHRRIAPDLIEMIQNDEENLSIRISSIWVLGKTRDATGLPVLKAIIGRPLPDEVSKEQYALLYNAILCVGMLADEEYLRFMATELCTEAYWLRRNGKAAKGYGTPMAFRNHMRLIALNGIALGGSQYAIEMFNSGSGVPEDLRSESEWLLKCAKMRNQGYILVKDYEARVQ